MDQSEDPRDLERKIEQATRVASNVTDETIVQRQRPSRTSQLVLEVGDADPRPCIDRDGHRSSAPTNP